MNILVITAVSGFLSKFELYDVKRLQALGYQVHYASNFENPVYRFDQQALKSMGVVCHHISIQKSPFALRRNHRALRQIRALIRRYHIRAIHCHNPMGGVIGRLAGIGSRKRAAAFFDDADETGGQQVYCIYTVHGFHFYHGAPAANWLFYPVEWFLARFTDQIVCINAEDQKRAEGFHLRRGGAVVRIPGPGLDLNRFQPGAEERKPLRAKLSLSQEDFVFLSVGELNKNKNHETVIRAFAAIKQERMKYLICGDGPERKRLNKLIAALGMEDSVFLCGYQENIERYYQCADCFLFPSLREGLGMAALEAMACGLPLIAADNRGSREYAGENAILCEAQNVVQFASAMERIVADRRSRDAMAAASQTIAERFSQEKTQAVMEQVYRRMDGRLHRTAG